MCVCVCVEKSMEDQEGQCFPPFPLFHLNSKTYIDHSFLATKSINVNGVVQVLRTKRRRIQSLPLASHHYSWILSLEPHSPRMVERFLLPRGRSSLPLQVAWECNGVQQQQQRQQHTHIYTLVHTYTQMNIHTYIHRNIFIHTCTQIYSQHTYFHRGKKQKSVNPPKTSKER